MNQRKMTTIYKSHRARDSGAAAAAFIKLLLLLLLINLIHNVTACTQSESEALGCDETLTGGYGGQPDGVGIGNIGGMTNKAGNHTICITAGSYSQLWIRYVQSTDPSQPIKFINCGGQVVFDGRNSGINNDQHWTTFYGVGSRHIHFTGSGHPDYKYGFVFTGSRSHGMNWNEGSSNIEIDHIETYDNNGVGVGIKSYPRCGGRCGYNPSHDLPSSFNNCTRGEFIQENTFVHDNYIHNEAEEGMYIGTSHFYEDGDATVKIGNGYCSSETWAQPELKGVKVYNNVIEDTGKDGIQIGAAVSDVAVHNNIIKRWSIGCYRAVASQSTCTSPGNIYGHANAIGMNPGSTGDVHDNWIEGTDTRYPDDTSEEFLELYIMDKVLIMNSAVFITTSLQGWKMPSCSSTERMHLGRSMSLRLTPSTISLALVR